VDRKGPKKIEQRGNSRGGQRDTTGSTNDQRRDSRQGTARSPRLTGCSKEGLEVFPTFWGIRGGLGAAPYRRGFGADVLRACKAYGHCTKAPKVSGNGAIVGE